VRRRADRLTLSAVVAVVVCVGGFAAFVLGRAESIALAASTPAAVQAAAVGAELERHKQEETSSRVILREDVAEVQRDVRALYRTVIDGARSTRLEAPATLGRDGGR
jgi:hypothetical protein